MSRLSGIWRTLDLAPTGDTAAIRKAYARALKTFDIDEEPARYIALRAARDAAMAQAPYFDADADADADLDAVADDEEDRATADALPVMHSHTLEPDALEPDALEWDERWSEDLDDERWQPDMPVAPPEAAEPQDDGAHAHDATMRDHYDAVQTMVFPGDERDGKPLDRIAASVLVERVEALLADPRMEGLAFHAAAERWFADIIASSPIRSDPILTLALGHFNWLASRGRIDQSPAVAAVVARYDALVFMTEVQDRKHPLHKAWRELRKPAQEGSRKTLGVSGSKVRRLLNEIRTRHPMLESELDWYRVSLWEARSGGATNWGAWWGGMVIIFLVLRLLAAGTDTQPPAATPIPVSSYASAAQLLDPMLATLGGPALTMATIRTQNPRLHGQLQTNWTLAGENKTDRITFAQTTYTLLMDRYSVGVRRAPHGLLVDLFTLRLDKARHLRARGWQACENFFVTGAAPAEWLSSDLLARDKTLVGRVLLETDGDPAASPPSTDFRVSGAIIDQAVKRAGMPRADFAKAMANKSNAETKCRASIALGEVALTLPATQADAILRNL
ncbi:hypothetical protein [Sphingomonas hylomeconis]|uniref:J domain-containing protein n=1 Tax=Sphingomonas hylomeconis TaxID=1395958 RepID=A0ABV7SYN9_9SPHN|nr:hypothetical protein [Sphingomonas hylomeconis]